MISNLFGPMVSIVLVVFFALLIFLYAISILWTLKDAKARGASRAPYKWLCIIPFVGVIAYILLRPPLLTIDREEQEVDIALKRRQLSFYGTCSNCGAAVQEDYLLCPVCGKQLKEPCDNCGSALDRKWTVCPYCGVSRVKHNIASHEIEDKEHDFPTHGSHEYSTTNINTTTDR